MSVDQQENLYQKPKLKLSIPKLVNPYLKVNEA